MSVIKKQGYSEEHRQEVEAAVLKAANRMSGKKRREFVTYLRNLVRAGERFRELED